MALRSKAGQVCAEAERPTGVESAAPAAYWKRAELQEHCFKERACPTLPDRVSFTILIDHGKRVFSGPIPRTGCRARSAENRRIVSE